MIFHILFALLIGIFPSKDDPELRVDLINPLLLINANAVVRYEDATCLIQKLDKMVYTETKAVTVLNEQGASAAYMYIFYRDKVDKVSDISIEIFDQDGKRLEKIKKKEIWDSSTFDGFSIAGDSRIKSFGHQSNNYPYTVKFSYEITKKNTLHIPNWRPITHTRVSVERSKYQVINKIDDNELLMKKKFTDGYDVTHEGSTFLLKNAMAASGEAYTPHVLTRVPHAIISPSKFEYYGREGNVKNWKAYGQWMFDNMLQNRCDITPNQYDEVKALLVHANTSVEKARIIYDYVTNNTRYVSVQLGIGGYQPFKCSDVHKLKYGDCKALSFYTANLLNHFGVEAIYTEIHSDRSYNVSYDDEIPGTYGNHVILCLPNEGDTLWLECTSNKSPFGVAHSGISNRRALLITEKGGKLVHTPDNTPDESYLEKTVNIVLTEEGSDLDITYEYHGALCQYPMYRVGLSEKKEKDMLKKRMPNLSKYTTNEYSVNVNEQKLFGKEHINITCNGLVEKAGNYKIIPLMTHTSIGRKVLNKNRVQDIYIKDYDRTIYTMNITIPEGYQVTGDFDCIELENMFGHIKCDESKAKDVLTITYDIQLNAGTYKSQMVGEFNQYCKKLEKVLKSKIVLKPI